MYLSFQDPQPSVLVYQFSRTCVQLGITDNAKIPANTISVSIGRSKRIATFPPRIITCINSLEPYNLNFLVFFINSCEQDLLQIFIAFIFHSLLSHFVGKIALLLPVCGEVLAQLGLINPIQQKTAATHFDRGELLEKHSIEMFEWQLVLITFQFQIQSCNLFHLFCYEKTMYPQKQDTLGNFSNTALTSLIA